MENLGFPLPYVVFAVFLSQAWIKENFVFPMPYVVFAKFLSQAWIKEDFVFPPPYVVFAMFLFQAWIKEVSSYWKLTVKSLPNFILDSNLKKSRSLPTLT